MVQRFLRLAALRALPVIVCFLTWLRYRSFRRRLKDDAPPVSDTKPEDDKVEVVESPPEVKERQQRERQPRSQLTDEEKAIVRAKKQQDAVIKLGHKRSEAAALLASLRDKFSEASSDAPLMLSAIDVEAWEQDGEKVTEIGLATAHVSFVDFSTFEALDAGIVFRHRHILIREHLALRNGIHVEDNKDNFLFGNSEIFDLAAAADEVASELNGSDLIVGHAVRADLAWLRKIGVSGLEANSLSLGSRLVDTQTLAFAGEAAVDGFQPQVGLRAMAEAYGLNPQRLHNGANDAAFTLQVMLLQCGVPFAAPARGTSNHRTAAYFGAAWLESLSNLEETQREQLIREEELRLQVAAFAASIKANAEAPGCRSAVDEAPVAVRFPVDLSSRERKMVHQAAEEAGLQSRSTEDGPHGERCVSIFSDGTIPMPAVGANTMPRGKRPKMRRSEWKRHCNATETRAQNP